MSGNRKRSLTDVMVDADSVLDGDGVFNQLLSSLHSSVSRSEGSSTHPEESREEVATKRCQRSVQDIRLIQKSVMEGKSGGAFSEGPLRAARNISQQQKRLCNAQERQAGRVPESDQPFLTRLLQSYAPEVSESNTSRDVLDEIPKAASPDNSVHLKAPPSSTIVSNESKNVPLSSAKASSSGGGRLSAAEGRLPRRTSVITTRSARVSPAQSQSYRQSPPSPPPVPIHIEDDEPPNGSGSSLSGTFPGESPTSTADSICEKLLSDFSGETLPENVQVDAESINVGLYAVQPRGRLLVAQDRVDLIQLDVDGNEVEKLLSLPRDAIIDVEYWLDSSYILSFKLSRNPRELDRTGQFFDFQAPTSDPRSKFWVVDSPGLDDATVHPERLAQFALAILRLDIPHYAMPQAMATAILNYTKEEAAASSPSLKVYSRRVTRGLERQRRLRLGDHVQPSAVRDAKPILVYPEPGAPGAVALTEQDLGRLRHAEYLNDSLLEFYFRWLEENDEVDTSSCLFFSTFFYSKLENYPLVTTMEDLNMPPPPLHKWTERLCRAASARHPSCPPSASVFDFRFLFVPICRENHWSVVVVCNPSSMFPDPGAPGVGGPLPEESPLMLLLCSLGIRQRKIFTQLRSFLTYEWHLRNPQFPKHFLTLRNFPDFTPQIPRQKNSYDCGVYLLHYVEMWLRDPPTVFTRVGLDKVGPKWFHASAIPRKRKFMLFLIQRLSCIQAGKEPPPFPPELLQPLISTDVDEELSDQSDPADSLQESVQILDMVGDTDGSTVGQESPVFINTSNQPHEKNRESHDLVDIETFSEVDRPSVDIDPPTDLVDNDS